MPVWRRRRMFSSSDSRQPTRRVRRPSRPAPPVCIAPPHWCRTRIGDVARWVRSTRRCVPMAVLGGGGARFMVGPLRKEDGAAPAGLRPSVPVLSLNYLEAGVATPENVFQFGLAPADEARSAAEQASATGLHRAAALVPDADWGRRALGAFDEALRANGGAVVSKIGRAHV